MEAYNVTRDRHLIEKGKVADSFWTRLRGLIGHDPLEAGEGLMIKPCKSVHMFFMRYPIDVIYVSGSGKVVELAPELQPNRVGPVVREASFVLEVPAGTIARTGTQVGDQVIVSNCEL